MIQPVSDFSMHASKCFAKQIQGLDSGRPRCEGSELCGGDASRLGDLMRSLKVYGENGTTDEQMPMYHWGMGMVCKEHRLVVFSTTFVPQIAGSYGGSYFSKIGLLIPKIPAAATLSPFICLPAWSPFCPTLPSFVSLHDLHSGLLLAAPVALSPFICLPAWSPFWPALGCSCLHLSPFVISILACSWLPCHLHLSPFICLHSGLLLAAPAFICLPSFVPLRDLHSGLLLAAPAFICPPSFVSLHDLHSGLLLATPAFICLPSFVSLRDLHSGLLLAAPAFICSPRELEAIGVFTSQWLACWSPKSLNGHDAAAALSPFISLHLSPFMISILGCRCRLVSLHMPPFMISCRCRLVSFRLPPFIAFDLPPSVGSCVRLLRPRPS